MMQALAASKRKRGTSGHRGVGYHKGSGSWRARISTTSGDGGQLELGYFKTFYEAACAYNNAAERGVDAADVDPAALSSAAGGLKQRISYDVAPASELASVAAVTPSDDKDRLTECYMFGAGGDGQLGRVGDSDVYRPRQLTFSRAASLRTPYSIEVYHARS